MDLYQAHGLADVLNNKLVSTVQVGLKGSVFSCLVDGIIRALFKPVENLF